MTEVGNKYNTEFQIKDARTDAEFYHEQGYDSFPLPHNSKAAALNDWQHREPGEMWQHASDDSNIAIRCGGTRKTCVVDCDNKNDPTTSARVLKFINGLGIHDFPQVQTPHDGNHIYLSLDHIPHGAYKQITRDFGRGEIRYGSGAYVAAPHSVIDDKPYKLVRGDFARLPIVRLADLLPLFGSEIETEQPATRLLEPKLQSKKLSRRARALLRGEGIERYQSRSEAEQALLASLVNSGFEFEDALSLFLDNPCAGKFGELYDKNPRNARRWLEHSFDNALDWTAKHESQGQIIARRALEFADSHAWHGQTGAVDRVVYIAHAEIALESKKIIYAAAARDLADFAGVGYSTAARASHRLVKNNYIRLEVEATFNLAAWYSLNPAPIRTNVHSGTLSHNKELRECASAHTSNHDAFRVRGMGKSAAHIWQVLNSTDEPMRVKDIENRTSRHRTTITRVLDKMRAYGMVEPGEIVGREITFRPVEDVDLNAVAAALGTSGKGAAQKNLHHSQREAHKAALTRGGVQ